MRMDDHYKMNDMKSILYIFYGLEFLEEHSDTRPYIIWNVCDFVMSLECMS